MAEFKDTLQLATEVKAKQGIHELEVSFGGELDLHKNFDNCPKNPGHVDFIPINKFSLSDLPKRHQTFYNYAFLNCLAKLTVKISVEYVSPRRPPGYALSDLSGQNVLTVGSGYFSHININEPESQFPCPIKNCSKLPGHHNVFGYFSIFTAAHVVFDDIEAENTFVEFFYDDPVNKAGVKKAEGVKVGAKCVEGDFTELLCVTHDKSLFNDVTSLLMGSDATFKSHLRKMVAELEPNLFTDSTWTNITKFNKNLRILDRADIEQTIFLDALVALTKFVADSFIMKICAFLNIFNILECQCTVKRVNNIFDFFLDFFNRELKEIISDGVDAVFRFYQENLDLDFLEPEVMVTGISSSDEMIETLVLLQKCEILWQKRRCIKSLADQEVADLDFFFKYLNYFTRSKKYLIKVNYKYHSPNTRDEAKPLIITISHPHGQSKHMTFGNFISCNTASGFYTHLYTTPTCHGSSGAPSWVVPSDAKEMKDEVYGVLHKGHHGNNLNEGNAWTVYAPFGDRICTRQKSCCRLLTAFKIFLTKSLNKHKAGQRYTENIRRGQYPAAISVEQAGCTGCCGSERR